MPVVVKSPPIPKTSLKLSFRGYHHCYTNQIRFSPSLGRYQSISAPRVVFYRRNRNIGSGPSCDEFQRAQAIIHQVGSSGVEEELLLAEAEDRGRRKACRAFAGKGEIGEPSQRVGKGRQNLMPNPRPRRRRQFLVKAMTSHLRIQEGKDGF